MREPVDVLVAEKVYGPVLEEIRQHEDRLRLKLIPRPERSRSLDLELLGDPEILMATFPPRNLRELRRLFKENLERYLAGEPLLNVIPPRELAGEHRGNV